MMNLVRYLLAILLSLVASDVTARSFDVLSYRPSTDHSPYFSLLNSGALGGSTFVVGSSFSYSQRNLEVADAQHIVQSVIRRMLVQHFFGSVKLANHRISLSASMPYVWSFDFQSPHVSGAPRTRQSGRGDLRLSGKIEIYPMEKAPVGISLVPFMTFPTGNGKYYLGNDDYTFGGLAVLDVLFVKYLRGTLNVGAQYRNKFKFRDLEQSSQIVYGLGFAYQPIKEFAAIVEVNGLTKASSPFDREIDNPAELLAGFRFQTPDEHIRIQFGGGFGIIHGAGAPLFRTIVGLSYTQ